MKKGIHGRNDIFFYEPDYQLLEKGNFQAIKMMSYTGNAAFTQLKERFPDMEIIARLYDTDLQNKYFNGGKHPDPDIFVRTFMDRIGVINNLCGCVKFEIHNEPNHEARYEGWGNSDEDATSFNSWFIGVFSIFKSIFPNFKFGFPGLAVPHRDLEWIKICKPAIKKADFLCNHSYWQTPEDQPNNHLDSSWGLRFEKYHELFPHHIIEITECGNSNCQGGIPIDDYELKRQYDEYFEYLKRYDYLNVVCPFLMSSPSKEWEGFTWRTEDGKLKAMV